jgi:hypothetical protein
MIRATDAAGLAVMLGSRWQTHRNIRELGRMPKGQRPFHQVLETAPKARVWTLPVLQGLRETAGIIGSSCSRVSGLERNLIAAGLDG